MGIIEFLTPYKAEITAVALPLVGGYIRYLASPRAKILYSKSHGFVYSPRTQDGAIHPVYTESYFFQNKGRKKSEEVEIVLGRRPQNFAIWPQRDYSTIENPEGFFVIKTQNLSRNEHFTLNLLEFEAQPPYVTNVRTADGISKQIAMAPLQVFPKWFNLFAALLFFVGLCSSLYLIIELLDFVLN